MWHQSAGCQASSTYTVSHIKDNRLRLHHTAWDRLCDWHSGAAMATWQPPRWGLLVLVVIDNNLKADVYYNRDVLSHTAGERQWGVRVFTSLCISHSRFRMQSSFLLRQRWAAMRFLLRLRMSWMYSSCSEVSLCIFTIIWKSLRGRFVIWSTGNGSLTCKDIHEQCVILWPFYFSSWKHFCSDIKSTSSEWQLIAEQGNLTQSATHKVFYYAIDLKKKKKNSPSSIENDLWVLMK